MNGSPVLQLHAVPTSEVPSGVAHLNQFKNLPEDERVAAYYVYEAGRHHKDTVGTEQSRHAFSEWYRRWLEHVKVSKTRESAILILEEMLALSNCSNEIDEDDLINRNALANVEEYWENQLKMYRNNEPNLLKKVGTADTNHVAAILFRVFPADSPESSKLMSEWAILHGFNKQ